MLTEGTSRKHLWSEDDDNVDYIDVKKKSILPSLDNSDDDISEKNTDTFERLLNGEKPDSLNQVKSKEGSRLRS